MPLSGLGDIHIPSGAGEAAGSSRSLGVGTQHTAAFDDAVLGTKRSAESDASDVATKKSASKGAQLRNIAVDTPEASPLGRLAATPGGKLVNKVAAPNAGDHSPSISAVNKGVADNGVKILGRQEKQPVPGSISVDQKDVPTLQFHGPAFDRNGTHDKALDSLTHTQLTSLREMHGAGERGQHATQADLRDATANSYSRINGSGDIDRDAPGLARVQVFSENQPGRHLESSPDGVDARVGQGIVNLSYAATEAARRGESLPEPLDGLKMREK